MSNYETLEFIVCRVFYNFKQRWIYFIFKKKVLFCNPNRFYRKGLCNFGAEFIIKPKIIQIKCLICVIFEVKLFWNSLYYELMLDILGWPKHCQGMFNRCFVPKKFIVSQVILLHKCYISVLIKVVNYIFFS